MGHGQGPQEDVHGQHSYHFVKFAQLKAITEQEILESTLNCYSKYGKIGENRNEYHSTNAFQQRS